MSSRRIALALMDPPLPFGNAASRWYYVLLRELVARGHRVTAFYGYQKKADREATADLFPHRSYDMHCFPVEQRSRWASKVQSVRRPFSYPFSREYQDALAQRLSDGVDVLHLEQLWTGWTGWDYTDRALLHLHYAHSIDQAAAPAGSLKERVLRARADNAERRILRHFHYISALTPRLRTFASLVNPSARTYTVPFGMDLTLYPYRDPVRQPVPVLGLIGSFNWTPSFLAGERLLTRLWPEIQCRVPRCRLLIVGRSARAAFPAFLQAPGVEIEENVADILPYFRRLSVLAYAPAVGTGMKVKILEAFSLGVPVVTNAEGMEGLEGRDGEHAAIAEDDQGLIDRAVRLLNNHEQGCLLARAARTLVENQCGLSHTVNMMETIHHEICVARENKPSAVAA